MSRRKRGLTLVVITFLVVLVSAACQTDQATPTPTMPAVTVTSPEGSITDVAPPDGPSGTILDCNDGDVANAYFVCNQLLMIGPSEAITRAASQLGLQEIDERLDLSFLSEDGYTPSDDRQSALAENQRQVSPEAQPARFPFHNLATGELIPDTQENLALGLFSYDPGQWTMTELLSATLALSEPVVADPNYLVGHLTKTPCANPFAVEGSPFAVEGSPFAVEGSPNGGKGLPAQPGEFWGQWAFEMIGIEQPSSEVQESGEESRVQVVVLDTSPFSSGTRRLEVEGSSATLHVKDIPPPPGQILSSEIPRPEVSVQDHGYFVSGLVHAVAPRAEIHLYPVLDSHGCGDLNTLVRVVIQSIRDMRDLRALETTVFNFSLGVKKPRLYPDNEALLENFSVASDVEAVLREFEEVEQAIETLEFALYEAYRRGAVLVAAAGNDSVDGLVRLGPELPAAYSFVLGVEAINMDKQLACFSNLGDLAAPGGDAIPGNEACEPQARTCPLAKPVNGQYCPWGVISVTTDSPTGYAYWEGTSFATPLVSGLAAALLDAGATNPEQVQTMVISSALPPEDPEANAIISVP